MSPGVAIGDPSPAEFSRVILETQHWKSTKLLCVKCETLVSPLYDKAIVIPLCQWATKRGMQQNVVGPVSKSISISPSISALTRRYLTTLHLKQHKDFQGSRIQPQHSRQQILQPRESNLHTCFRLASDAVQTRIGATIDHFWT